MFPLAGIKAWHSSCLLAKNLGFVLVHILQGQDFILSTNLGGGVWPPSDTRDTLVHYCGALDIPPDSMLLLQTSLWSNERMHHFQVPAFYLVARSPLFLSNSCFSRSSSKESIVVNLLKHERWRYMGGPAPQATGCCCLWHMCVPFSDKRAKHLFFLDQNQTSASACSSHYPSHSGAVFDVVHRNRNPIPFPCMRFEFFTAQQLKWRSCQP